jgi:hypothetical protein
VPRFIVMPGHRVRPIQPGKKFMRAIAASIVVFAGAHLMGAGAAAPHPTDTAGFVLLLGAGVGLVGSWLLFREFKSDSKGQGRD